jgi:hypothetical protein
MSVEHARRPNALTIEEPKARKRPHALPIGEPTVRPNALEIKEPSKTHAHESAALETDTPVEAPVEGEASRQRTPSPPVSRLGRWMGQ